MNIGNVNKNVYLQYNGKLKHGTTKIIWIYRKLDYGLSWSGPCYLDSVSTGIITCRKRLCLSGDTCTTCYWKQYYHY